MTQILWWGHTVRNDDMKGPTQRNLGKDSQTRKTHVPGTPPLSQTLQHRILLLRTWAQERELPVFYQCPNKSASVGLQLRGDVGATHTCFDRDLCVSSMSGLK